MSYAKLQRPKGHAHEKSGPTPSNIVRGRKSAAPTADAGFRLHGAQPGPSPTRPNVAVQTELRIGRKNDPAEREADHFAERFIHDEKIGVSASGAALTTILPEQDLPPRMRKTLSTIAGGHFGPISIHADSRANAVAVCLNSRAVTIGRDIFFARGECRPQTAEGSRLLSHEMVHVAQQRREGHSFPQSKLSIGRQSIPSVESSVLASFVPEPTKRYIVQYMQSSKEKFIFENHEGFMAEVEARVGVLNRFPAVRATLLPSDTTPASPRANTARALFMQRDQLEGSALSLEEFERRVELMDLSLRLHGLRIGIADSRPRADSQAARDTLERRGKAQWYDAVRVVGSFNEAIALIQDNLSALEAAGKIAPGEGIVRELAVFGHGFSGNELTGFQIGEDLVTLEYLKTEETGKLASLFVDGATIDLVGCDAANGTSGDEFMVEMGRVFFGGKKRGYIRANTCTTTTLIPELETAMMPCSPKTLRWPLNFGSP